MKIHTHMDLLATNHSRRLFSLYSLFASKILLKNDQKRPKKRNITTEQQKGRKQITTKRTREKVNIVIFDTPNTTYLCCAYKVIQSQNNREPPLSNDKRNNEIKKN